MKQMVRMIDVWRWLEEATPKEKAQEKARINFAANTYRLRMVANQKAESEVKE